MRIVIIRTNGVNPDPRVEKEANSLISTGEHSVTILAWDRESDVPMRESKLHLSNGDVTIVRFGILSEWGGGMKKNLIPLLKYTLKVKKWLSKHESEFDCIHACDYPTAVMAKKYIHKKKFVLDIFDFFADTAHAPKLVLNYARKSEQWYINNVDATIICSEQRKVQIGDVAPKNLVVIHNSPDKTLFETIETSNVAICKSRTEKKKLVYVGNLIEERFIKEVIQIVAERTDVELHIGGMGNLQDVVSEAAGHSDNIFYYGKMKYSDVLALEKECDIMLALYDPSIKNNRYAAPNKFYEALLVGKPLLMFENTGMDRIVKENGIGVIAQPNIESINSAIDQVIKLPAEKIKEKEITLYETRYTWKVMEERLLQMYKNL